MTSWFITTSAAPGGGSGGGVTLTAEVLQNWTRESHGPMPKDGCNRHVALRDAIKKLNADVAANARGAQVSDAISALHAQHRSNGMPPRWLP